MRKPRRLRIAILAHSTIPRGGVVHALELGATLARMGHEAAVHAPDPGGKGFFRHPVCRTVCVPATPAGHAVADMVEVRVADYLRFFELASHREFDVFHAQDGISGNALATLKQNGLIGPFARTVHHLDQFHDPKLQALQDRAITSADRLFVVSRLWQERLARSYGRAATVVGNGVDTERFSNRAHPRDAALRQRLARHHGPVILSVGGVEERKNTHRILQAFQILRQAWPTARLIIAGGSSLLDHSAYQSQFAELFRASRLPAEAVLRTGSIPDADMPSLYRLADVLVFPSLQEGFGLVVLEAMASGVPVVTSHLPPFTEYLGEDAAFWCDPCDIASITAATLRALDPRRRWPKIIRGLAVARRHDWIKAAQSHLPDYLSLIEPAYA
jgi:glycosyltransferase-like protein